MNHQNHRESIIEYPVSSIKNRESSIENPTLAHFRHFSSLFTLSPLYICRETSTNQLLFMQNKPNFKDAKMNVNIYYTKAYNNETVSGSRKNKPNSNPISKQLVAARPRRPESAKMAQKIDVLKHQNIILKKSNFLYPNRLNSLCQPGPLTGTSFAYLEYMR